MTTTCRTGGAAAVAKGGEAAAVNGGPAAPASAATAAPATQRWTYLRINKPPFATHRNCVRTSPRRRVSPGNLSRLWVASLGDPHGLSARPGISRLIAAAVAYS